MNVKTLKYSVAVGMVAFLSSSSALIAMEQDALDIDKTTTISQNFRSRASKNPQILILHCVGLSDEWVHKHYGLSIINEGLGVSAHYYVSQESNVTYQFVPEEMSAFHAGPSEWRSMAKNNLLQGLNDISIGIEFQSRGYAQINGKAYYPYSFGPYTTEQMKSGELLSQQIMKTHNISPENVVWHSDVSPLRKTDPGALFDGERLAQKGIGVWPAADRLEDSQLDISLKAIQTGLKEWGYPHIEQTGLFDEPTKYVLAAHYMHYLPGKVNWDDYKSKTTGSIFDNINNWDDFLYDKEVLAISLENLNKKNYAF